MLLSTLPKSGLLLPGSGSEEPMSGFHAGKQGLDKKVKEQFGAVPHWQLHDLRRTFSTGLARLGVFPHVKEALLNHTAAKTDVERVYDHYNYLSEMRAAMILWENHLASLPKPG